MPSAAAHNYIRSTLLDPPPVVQRLYIIHCRVGVVVIPGSPMLSCIDQLYCVLKCPIRTVTVDNHITLHITDMPCLCISELLCAQQGFSLWSHFFALLLFELGCSAQSATDVLMLQFCLHNTCFCTNWSGFVMLFVIFGSWFIGFCRWILWFLFIPGCLWLPGMGCAAVRWAMDSQNALCLPWSVLWKASLSVEGLLMARLVYSSMGS